MYEKYKSAFEKLEHEKNVFGVQMRSSLGDMRVSSSIEGLVDLINYCSINETSKVVEVGSWYGGSTILFAESGADVTAVDPWSNDVSDIKVAQSKATQEDFDGVEAMFDRNTAGYKNIKKLKMTSSEAAKQFEDHSLDVVYIDANHNYEDTIKDMETWIPKIKKGGWITGHDLALPGVIKACLDMLPGLPRVFKDTSWAYKLEEGLGYGVNVFIGTAMNFDYVSKAHQYFASLNNMISGNHIIKFCVTLGFEASDVLKKLYPTINFVRKDTSTIRWLNTNFCVQHGDFLDCLNAKDEDIVIFTDADILIQRQFTSFDYCYLGSLADGEICLAMNSGKDDNLGREYERLKLLAGEEFKTPDAGVIDAHFKINMAHLPCYNTGVVACNYKTYNMMLEEYLKDADFVDKAFGHYAKQQWLMSLVASTRMKVIPMPDGIHAHGHGGTPENIDFHRDVAFGTVRMFGGNETKQEILFRHNLPQPRKLITLIYADDGGCVWYRLIMPHQWLKKQHPSIWEVAGSPEYTNAGLNKSAIVVVQRCQDMNHLWTIKDWSSKRTKIVWDGDDDYLRVDDKNKPGHGSMLPQYVTGLKAWLKNVDAITVTSEYLKDYYQKATKTKVPIYVFPNAVDFTVWDKHYETRKHVEKSKGEIVIGWHGGCSHASDFEETYEWMSKLLCKYYGKIKFHIVGWNFTDLEQYNDGEFRKHVRYFDWTKDTPGFGKNLVTFDIGIAPLSLKVPFNLSKSNIKYVEYSALGIPTVATDIEPYKDIKHGETGYKVDNSVDAWVDTLSMLIEDPELRNRIGENARQYCKENHNLAIEAEKRHKVYEEILAGGKKDVDGRCPSTTEK